MEDDSCPKCGHTSSTGGAHFVCPTECLSCGWLGYPAQGADCPSCHVWEIFAEMSQDEKCCMKELLNG